MRIPFEQAVYGSFPFWNRGYGVLTHSQGCRPEWLAELRNVCQRYGEPPTGAASRRVRLLRIAATKRPVADRGRSFSGLRRPRPAGCTGVSRAVRQPLGLIAGPEAIRSRSTSELRGDWCAEDENRALPAAI